MSKDKKSIALIGPVLCNSGIATVINTIRNCKMLKNGYELLIFNTTNYNDSHFFINLVIFIRSLVIYLKKLLEGKIDLAHVHASYGRSFYRKFFFILLSSFFRVKIILHFHASKFDEFFIDSHGIRTKLIEFSLKRSDAIILLCKDWKEKLENTFAVKNAFVINNPVPLSIDQTAVNAMKLSKNSVTILFIGFLIKTKGIYDLLKIAERLKEISVEHEIIVCGKGREEAKFIKKIKEKNIDSVKYMGWVSGTKKENFYKDCDIFLLPSYNEGMPMVILEAMAFGLPVVSTRISGIPEMVVEGDNGYLLRPGDIDGFVEKIKILILNPTLRQKFGNRSRAIVENFKKEKILEEWHKLYQRLLNIS